MHRLLNAKDSWRGFGVSTSDQALEICKSEMLDLVLLGNGIYAEEEDILRKKLIEVKPNIKIIQHYGGGSGLLFSEIAQALA